MASFRANGLTNIDAIYTAISSYAPTKCGATQEPQEIFLFAPLAAEAE